MLKKTLFSIAFISAVLTLNACGDGTQLQPLGLCNAATFQHRCLSNTQLLACKVDQQTIIDCAAENKVCDATKAECITKETLITCDPNTHTETCDPNNNKNIIKCVDSKASSTPCPTDTPICKDNKCTKDEESKDCDPNTHTETCDPNNNKNIIKCVDSKTSSTPCPTDTPICKDNKCTKDDSPSEEKCTPESFKPTCNENAIRTCTEEGKYKDEPCKEPNATCQLINNVPTCVECNPETYIPTCFEKKQPNLINACFHNAILPRPCPQGHTCIVNEQTQRAECKSTQNLEEGADCDPSVNEVFSCADETTIIKCSETGKIEKAKCEANEGETPICATLKGFSFCTTTCDTQKDPACKTENLKDKAFEACTKDDNSKLIKFQYTSYIDENNDLIECNINEDNITSKKLPCNLNHGAQNINTLFIRGILSPQCTAIPCSKQDLILPTQCKNDVFIFCNSDLTSSSPTPTLDYYTCASKNTETSNFKCQNVITTNDAKEDAPLNAGPQCVETCKNNDGLTGSSRGLCSEDKTKVYYCKDGAPIEHTCEKIDENTDACQMKNTENEEGQSASCKFID